MFKNLFILLFIVFFLSVSTLVKADDAEVTVELKQISANENDEIIVPVHVTSTAVDKMALFEFHIEFDIDKLEFIEVVDIDSELLDLISVNNPTNQLNFIWLVYDIEQRFVLTERDLFKLKFKVKSKISSNEENMKFKEPLIFAKPDESLFKTVFSNGVSEVLVVDEPVNNTSGSSSSGPSGSSGSTTTDDINDKVTTTKEIQNELEKNEELKIEGPQNLDEYLKTIDESEMDSEFKNKINSLRKKENTVFVDLKSHWAKAYVVKLSEKGIIKKQTNYRPNDGVNRAELAKMLSEAFSLGQNNTPKSNFNDVSNIAWFAPYVYKLQELEIIKGYSDNTYKPEKIVNRAEALKMILEASGEKVFTGKQSFSDVPADAWFEPYVAYAFSQGIVKGISADSFNPEGKVTRGQVSKMISLVLD